MKLIPWDPGEEFDRVRQRTDRLWDEFLQKITEGLERQVDFLPTADLVESASDYRLFVAVPGFVEEDIEIGIDDRSLVVRGERLPPYDPARATSQVCEWRYGFFERRFDLPTPIDVESLRARYDAGVLTITVGKMNVAGKTKP
jgi:HSP20 family protein